jgi:AcrR family transcriptional regulator
MTRTRATGVAARTSVEGAEPVAAAVPGPTFRRAGPKDAIDAAHATFLAGERVDMGTLATQLAMSRATIYRWFGSRDQLLEQVLVRLAQGFSASARAEAGGDGDERIVDFARRIADATIQFEPLRGFVAREPQLALRLLIGERGAVHATLAEALSGVVSETHLAPEAAALAPLVDVVVQVAATLLWAGLAIGDEPHTERVVEIVRVMLASGRMAPATGA